MDLVDASFEIKKHWEYAWLYRMLNERKGEPLS